MTSGGTPLRRRIRTMARTQSYARTITRTRDFIALSIAQFSQTLPEGPYYITQLDSNSILSGNSRAPIPRVARAVRVVRSPAALRIRTDLNGASTCPRWMRPATCTRPARMATYTCCPKVIQESLRRLPETCSSMWRWGVHTALDRPRRANLYAERRTHVRGRQLENLARLRESTTCGRESAQHE
jgi:hypothetical protein